MSIVGQGGSAIVVYAAVLAICGGLCAVVGVFRRRSVEGPDRFPANRSLWALVGAGGCGFIVWFLGQAVLATIFVARRGPAARGRAEIAFSPLEISLLASIPPVVALGWTLFLDYAVGGPALVRQLGFARERLPAKIGAGLVGCIIVLPLVFLAGDVLDPIYRHFHYVHPNEHELLKVMGESSRPIVRVILVLGAVVCAPVWEETLFRGHLQTIIRQMLLRLTRVRPSIRAVAQGFPIAPAASETIVPAASAPIEISDESAPAASAPLDASVEPVAPKENSPAEPVLDLVSGEAEGEDGGARVPAGENLPVLPLPYATPRQGGGAVETWIAILITATMFALVHPHWMSPLIFVLALGLGYAYERTGSLWTCITIHAIFNGVETALFLYLHTT